jgi:hypothetical protein
VAVRGLSPACLKTPRNPSSAACACRPGRRRLTEPSPELPEALGSPKRFNPIWPTQLNAAAPELGCRPHPQQLPRTELATPRRGRARPSGNAQGGIQVAVASPGPQPLAVPPETRAPLTRTDQRPSPPSGHMRVKLTGLHAHPGPALPPLGMHPLAHREPGLLTRALTRNWIFRALLSQNARKNTRVTRITRVLSVPRALRIHDILVWSLSVVGWSAGRGVTATVPLSRTLMMLSLRAEVGPPRPYSRSVSRDAHGG